MKLHLKNIDYDKLTIGTEVYSIWNTNKNKKPIGIVISKEFGGVFNFGYARIKTEIKSDYCKCCNRGNKEITYKYTRINLSELKYKKYNK